MRISLSRFLVASALVAAWATAFTLPAVADELLDRAQAAFTAGRHLDAAEALGWPPPGISYRRAALLAQTGDMDGAFAMLDDAVAKGLPATAPQPADALMETMRTDPRYAKFLEALDRSARVPTKLTFFRQGPDQVRQLSEVSIDGGKTWTINYDLIYTRRKSETPATTKK